MGLKEFLEKILPIKSPLRDIEDDKPHPPITTRVGRVVYKRRPHAFTAADVRRVFIAAFRPTALSPGGIIAALVKFDLYILGWLLLTYPRKGLWPITWYVDYLKAMWEGIQGLLEAVGRSQEEIADEIGYSPPSTVVDEIPI